MRNTHHALSQFPRACASINNRKQYPSESTQTRSTTHSPIEIETIASRQPPMTSTIRNAPTPTPTREPAAVAAAAAAPPLWSPARLYDGHHIFHVVFFAPFRTESIVIQPESEFTEHTQNKNKINQRDISPPTMRRRKEQQMKRKKLEGGRSVSPLFIHTENPPVPELSTRARQ